MLLVNEDLNYLDLFDVDITNEGAEELIGTLKKSKGLHWLRLANTHLSSDYAEELLSSIRENPALKVFRWVNLLPIRNRSL
jgi:hypothetical protein